MKYIIGLVFLISILSSNETKIEGKVYINDKVMQPNMKVNLGDFIKTGKNSKVTFKIGEDAFMAKENTRFVITKEKGVKNLNVVTGGVLGVFKKGSKYNIKTENMTAGIRGTGIFVESTKGKSYFCTCYGDTEVQSDKEHKHMHATHHNMIWVKKYGAMSPAKKMRGHNDDELRALESMVGRVPAFDK
ncbi:MAG TPA: hypothetical protein ENK66_00595 [Arcobacter sp.]|jgi:hypothetical protein|nr:hypothetical protein [Arcobacter sp.]